MDEVEWREDGKVPCLFVAAGTAAMVIMSPVASWIAWTTLVDLWAR